jgi:hypothetical protein
MDTKTSFTQAHLENRLWINELEFYRDEINIYQIHFEEVMARNTSLQESEKVDSFRNQFARHRDLINELESELITAENKMAAYARTDTTADLDEVIVADHFQFGERMESFKTGYQNLKNDFKRFEAEW